MPRAAVDRESLSPCHLPEYLVRGVRGRLYECGTLHAGACVRLDALTLDELALIDDHPLVRACMRATSLVARAYLNEMQAGLCGAGSAPHQRRDPRRRGRRGPPLEEHSGSSMQSDVPSGRGLLAAHRAAVLELRAADGGANTQDRLCGDHAAARGMADAEGMADAMPAGAARTEDGGGPGLSEEPLAARRRCGSLPTEMLASPARRLAVQPAQPAAHPEGRSQRSTSPCVRRRLRLE